VTVTRTRSGGTIFDLVAWGGRLQASHRQQCSAMKSTTEEETRRSQQENIKNFLMKKKIGEGRVDFRRQ
jgi:hypothetical protein